MIEIDPQYRDLLAQLSAATTAQEEAQKRVDELGAERARILAQLHTTGLSYRQIAGLLTVAQMPMSASRIQKLIERTRRGPTESLPVRASRPGSPA